MPNITIEEKILNRSINTLGTDIPYIPGFMGNTPGTTLDDFGDFPRLFTSLRDFQAKVGKRPYCFNVAHTDDSTNEIVQAGSYDISYIMACELLKQGMPVYYHAFTATNDSDTKIVFTDIIDGKLSTENDFEYCTGDNIRLTFTEADKEANLTFNLAVALAKDKTVDIDFEFEAPDDFKFEAPEGGTEDTFTLTLDNTKFDANNKVILDDGIAEDTPISLTINATCAGTYIIKGLKIGYREESDITLNTIQTFYRRLNTYLTSKDLTDKGEYTIKYLTTGGYPNIGISVGSIDIFKSMLNIVTDRKDCIAIAEYLNDEEASLTNSNSFKSVLTTNKGDYASEYATAFYPWSEQTLSAKYEDTDVFMMPACYSYLIGLAKSIKTNPNWLAIAGIGRGYISSIKKLNLKNRLSNTIADNYQPTEETCDTNGEVALNAITMIKPYGYTIWGNRTLKEVKLDEKLTASHFLNTRNMINDIKKVCYSAAKSLMFEQNSDILWLAFKGKITPYLERLTTGNGISGYSILKSDIKTNEKEAGKEELACTIHIYPVNAVEGFDIGVVISDSDVVVE